MLPEIIAILKFIEANVNNGKLTASEFREVVRTTLRDVDLDQAERLLSVQQNKDNK